MEKSIQLEQLTLGVCYYPEHWPEALWADDLRRMLDAGIQVIRVAEFAWNKFEPQEGTFTFDFFDRFLDVVEQTPMKVIFCTPTATPPAWLTEKYPEVLNADRDGTLLRHGLRRHYNYSSTVYREKTEKIVSALAEHYGERPCIVGWQIDNELNCERDAFYSDADHRAFRVFLQERYGSIESLNEAWGTVFWNQTYDDFSQVYLPRHNANGSVNPHQALDARRFWSWSARSYCALQAGILRKHLRPGVFVTTNGVFGHLDSHAMTKESLDFITYDSYPDFAYGMDFQSANPNRDRAWSWNLCQTRSISKNFGIMEQQSGPNGWYDRSAAASPKPGQLRLWTMQSVAHGADFVSYFRWRTCWVGTEIYWHGILNYDNRDNRRLREVKQVHGDLAKLREIAGRPYQADVALLFDYANEWDGELDVWHGPVGRRSQDSWFDTLQREHVPCDFLYLREDTALEDLKKYRLLVYPRAAIQTEASARLLTAYVEQGGTLVLCPRTGYKDEFGRCPMLPMPGPLAALAGGTVEDFTFLSRHDSQGRVELLGKSCDAPLFHEILEPVEAEVAGTYQSGWYRGKPAVLRRSLGAGVCWTFGCAFSQELVAALLQALDLRSPAAGLLDLPAGVELAVRGGVVFVLNYQDAPAEVAAHQEFEDLLTGDTVQGEYTVPPFGVLALKA